MKQEFCYGCKLYGATDQGGTFQKLAMLVCDHFRPQWTESVKKKLDQFRTHRAVIPGDLTNVLQPISVLSKPFKEHVNKSWILWMTLNQVENASSGNLKTPDLSTVVGWVKQAWQSLPDGMVRRSFLRIGIDNSLDDTQDEQLCEEELKEELEDDDEATGLSDMGDGIAGSMDSEVVGMEKSNFIHSANQTLEEYVTQTEIIEFENGIKLKVEDISASTDTKTKPQKPQPVPPRSDSSLVFLTQKFAEKLSRTVDGVLDINQLSQEFSVHKRRIYDVTNVLEGIKLIKKKSKSRIQWLGKNVNNGKISQQMMSLIEEEKILDELIQSCAQQIRKLCEDRHTHRYAYLTHADIRRIQSFKEQTVIVIKAPADSNIQVPHPEESLQIYIKSVNGPIEVFLCPDTVESSDNTAADRADGSQFSSTTSENDSLPSPSLPCPQESSTNANSSCEINGFSHHSPS
ncbi:uncharacterized protein LOC106526948 isoform X2 [Austrofundulus limnaeus]|uniref:Uncharacterized protein LOC106526948 isoform X2 n=1 Tax=Austrofundulus limnaeus TaxID=52670 RepID=A0A2I4CAX4_AUSLI|nr:PREDICTED: uncharacterized protein LOC106526948 isoform X2 [Austrofundulus limnaeus]XP_013877140.1 PREDICTED: uncharacterized protein LOC106526948 isoform X2 [Austrofundulus limnaeus]